MKVLRPLFHQTGMNIVADFHLEYCIERDSWKIQTK